MKRIQSIRPPKQLFLKLMLLLAMAIPAFGRACLIARDPAPATSLETVANASNQFGFQLYQEIIKGKSGDNQFMSPFSVFAALSMTSEGAANGTLTLLSKVLGLPETKILHEGLAELSKALTPENAPYALAIANAIWPEKSFDLKPEFAATIQKVYAGASIPQDFTGNYEGARKTINQWVEQRTNKRIVDLLPPGSLNEMTRMVLTNAIFFKGKWALEFDKKLTEVQPFHLENGKDVQAPLMYLPSENYLRYGEFDGIQALQLPYKGGDLSMVILLPKLGKMDKFEASLDSNIWAKVNYMSSERVNVWLPSFKMEIGGSMKEPLSDMGMEPLFENADFSRMFSDKVPFAISDVIHKAFVEVNEEGTEAAAATAVITVETTSMPRPQPEPKNFRADHPFIFMIQHNASKSILFMGKVMNPS